MQKRNLISLKRACEKGNFGRTKAYELINAGKITAYKDGGRTLVDADSLDAYQGALPRLGPGVKKQPASRTSNAPDEPVRR